MYCTQQVIQGENFCDWLKTAKTVKVFPLESFAVYGIYMYFKIYASWQTQNILGQGCWYKLCMVTYCVHEYLKGFTCLTHMTSVGLALHMHVTCTWHACGMHVACMHTSHTQSNSNTHGITL